MNHMVSTTHLPPLWAPPLPGLCLGPPEQIQYSPFLPWLCYTCGVCRPLCQGMQRSINILKQGGPRPCRFVSRFQVQLKLAKFLCRLSSSNITLNSLKRYGPCQVHPQSPISAAAGHLLINLFVISFFVFDSHVDVGLATPHQDVFRTVKYARKAASNTSSSYKSKALIENFESW